MADIDYFNILKKSWNDLKGNTILVVPVLISILLAMGVIVIIGIEIGIFVVIFSVGGINDIHYLLQFPGSLIAGVLITIDLLILIGIGAYVRSMLVGMLNDIMVYKETNLEKMISHGKQHFFRFFKLNLLQSLMLIIPLAILAAISIPLIITSKVIGIVVAVISGILFILYAMVVTFFLYFVDPIFITGNDDAIEIIKSAFSYTLKNFRHVFYTWGVSVIVAMAVSTGIVIISLPVSIISEVVAVFPPLIIVMGVIGVALGILRVVINIALQLIISLFMFNSYYTKNDLFLKKKVAKKR